MTDGLLNVTNLGLSFIVLLGAYLILAFGLGLGARAATFWQRISGLSLTATVIWLILAVALSYFVLFDNPSAILAESHALAATFGMPFEWNIPARFLSVPTVEVNGWIRLSCTSGIVGVILFLLALVPYTLAYTLASCQRRMTSRTNAARKGG
jgi:hypothetical protein